MTDASTTQAEPQGIGGWLIFPMLATIISPLLSAIGLFQNVDALVKYRHAQTAVWSYLVIGEIVFTLAIIAGWIFAAVMLFKHKRIFPALFVFTLGAVLVLNLADLVAVKVGLEPGP